MIIRGDRHRREWAHRHGQEFARAVRDGAWERTEAGGILFPRQGAMLTGEVTARTSQGSITQGNRVLSGWMANMLEAFIPGHNGIDITLGAAGDPGGHTLALWGNDTIPTLAWEQAYLDDPNHGSELVNEEVLFHDLGEIDGYDEAARPDWIWDDEGGGEVSNRSSPAVFTIDGPQSVRGLALTTSGSGKMAGQPYPDNPSSVTGTVDISACFGQDVAESLSNYYPPGTNGPVGLNSTSIWSDHLSAGRSIELASSNGPEQGAIDLYTTAEVLHWWDPSGDDYFDTNTGFWVDPSGDSIVTYNNVAIIAVVRFNSLLELPDNDVFNVTWGFKIQ